MEYRKYFLLFLITLSCFLPCGRLLAQKVNTDSLRIARQKTTDSLRADQQRKTDSLRADRQRVIDSSRRIIQQRTDSLAAIRKYKESKRYKDSVIKSRQSSLDSVKRIRTSFFDSVKTERKRILDSSVAARKLVSDSLQKRQKIRTDSLERIRKYKESRRYTDSVAKARNHHIDSIRNIRTQFFDSVKADRKHVLDSAMASRKHISDSLHQKQKIRADSLAVIRKYKESKRYRDSVAVKRQAFTDSLRSVRKNISDSLIAKRKHVTDSAKAARKVIMDSTMASRKIIMDSLKNVRQTRADSLAKLKEKRAKDAKARVKKAEEKQKLALELKIAKKHKEFNNEKMLKKKWSIVRRSFQNMFTRYNYYFNAKRKMIEANGNMVRRKKDDFDRLIDLFPFDPNIDSTAFSADMDSIVRKASIGLQIHDPRTKWADDLYLLMGQAFYYKGNYESAGVTFRYIIGMKNRNLNKKKKSGAAPKKTTESSLVEKEKSKFMRLIQHQPAHNDAVLWLARTYSDSRRQAEAEAILDLLDGTSQLSEGMKAKIALEKANLLIRRGAYREASQQLLLVTDSKAIAKYTRQRAAYLNGQLLQSTGDYTASAASFRTALNLHPAIEMDFYARKEMASSLMLAGGEQEGAIASLKKVLKDGKYAAYQEQVYYLLGKLSANNNKPEEALDYLTKGLRLAKTTKKQKALTFAAIGNIQYASGNYNAAKRAYDSASYFAKYAPDNQDVLAAIRKGQSLDKVEEPYNTMRAQDSLLRLAAMSERDQRSVVRKYRKYLEQLKADSILAAQAPQQMDATPAPGSATTSSWYFASPVAVQQGYNDFKRKWGSRPLSDNWRRSSSSAFGSGGVDSSNLSAADDQESGDDGLPSEESLMAGIPKTQQQRDAAAKKLRLAYITLGDAYIKDLEDYGSGLKILDTLDLRYPDHEYHDQATYLRYLAALRQNKIEEAQQISAQLAANYPDSKWTKIVQPDTDAPQAESALPDNVSVSEYYETTYSLAMDHRYDEVLQRISTAKKHFGDVNYSRKFRILEAMSLAGTGQYNKADTAVAQYLREYPADSLKGWAEAVAAYVKGKRATDTLGSIMEAKTDSLAAASKLKSDSLAAAKTLAPDKFVYKASEVHYTLFVFGKPDVKISGFKSGLSDYGTFKFGNLGLSTKLEMLNADQSMVVTRQFANAAQAKIFMKAAGNEQLLFRDIPSGSYQVFIISESNYLKLITDKNITDYSSFYKKNYK